jgi:hypothetical protein
VDGVTLLREARQAGLRITATGETLVVQGPRRLEPMARALLVEKPQILRALADEDELVAGPEGRSRPAGGVAPFGTPSHTQPRRGQPPRATWSPLVAALADAILEAHAKRPGLSGGSHGKVPDASEPDTSAWTAPLPRQASGRTAARCHLVVMDGN